jgi:hypothetical protein
MISEEIVAFGHSLVRARHKTTIEVTKEEFLTKKGDCIIAVKANKACFDFSDELKKALKQDKKVKIILEVNGIKDEVIAFGSSELLLESKKSIVIRKSSFIDDRTIAIKANKSAADLDRRLVEELKNPKAKLIVRLIV